MVLQKQEIPVEAVESAVEAIGRDLAHFSIGFIKFVRTRTGLSCALAGSGTLVKAKDVSAILTAAHVVKYLPRHEPLGLILSRELQDYKIDPQDVSFREIAQGAVESKGPDIGAVILSKDVAGAIEARKSSVNLEGHRDMALGAPMDIDDGIWILQGFVAETSREEAGTGRYSKVTSLGEYSFGCVPRPQIERGGHDYFDVGFTVRPDLPQDFQGVSGGGLWQVALEKGAGGQLSHRRPLLSGIAFYQGP